MGVDLSQKALEVAEKNAGRLIGRRENAADGADAPLIQWTQSDLFENIKGTYDMIVSNPPYIPAGDISFLMEEVRDYEPLEALDGKEDGLFFYRRIAAEANKFLKSGGYLFFEIGCGQAEDVRRIMEGNGYQDIVVVIKCDDIACFIFFTVQRHHDILILQGFRHGRSADLQDREQQHGDQHRNRSDHQQRKDRALQDLPKTILILFSLKLCL